MKNFLKSGWMKGILIVGVLALLGNAFFTQETDTVSYRTVTAERKDIETTVEGSGAILPSESRKVYTKVPAEVKEIFFEEGEWVKEGQVLAKLDTGTYSSQLEAQKIAIEQAKLSIETIQKQMKDLTIVANANGYVAGMAISEGSYLTATMPVCNIVEEGAFEIVLPFGYSEVNQIQVGNSAKVQLLDNFATLEGTVTKVSEMRKLAAGSSQVVDVTIGINTTGYSLAGAKAKGEVFVNNVRLGSTDVGIFTMHQSNVVRAKATGTVEQIQVYDGKYVHQGEVIAVLSNEDLVTSLTNATLNLRNLQTQYQATQDQLNDYTIKAPINGTITSKTAQEGDLLAAGMTIATISNQEVLEFKIPIDELEIAKLNENQEVRVTIDALEDTMDHPIPGKISQLPLEGVATAGVTEYYVTIQIPGEERIRIAMNANAEIVVSRFQNVLVVPVDAVTRENEEATVTILLEDGTTERKVVELGERNVSNVQIKSGISEGDKVVVPQLNDAYSWF